MDIDASRSGGVDYVMRNAPSEDTFDRLLVALDPDRDRAAERYEELRRRLNRFFEWRGAPFPEEHTDETFDRVARRLGEGVAVSNIGGYTYAVAKLVLLETRKGPDSRRAEVDLTVTPSALPELATDEGEARHTCLDRCLNDLPPDSRALIVEYYRDDHRARIETRRALAARLRINGEALANRAQRLRDKLHACVRGCLDTGGAT
jgi:DNA-directed RNA polymerase specialized sigma24 family protein